MQFVKSAGLIIGATAFLTLSATQAVAQPTLSGAANGSAVSIQWTPVPGATSYNIVVVGSASLDVTVPPSPTAAVANPVPPGTYNIQVRPIVGGAFGPFSNTVVIVVGGAAPPPGSCPPLPAPVLTVTSSGTTVTFSWTNVGATGHRLQVGNTPGGTLAQIDLGTGQTTYTVPNVPVGTYYARVLAANACLNLTPSAEQQFTVGSPTPGPQPPPPPSGGGLPFPIPAVCSTGDELGCVLAIANLSAEWGQCRAGIGVGCNRFSRQVVYALSRTDPNWKMIRAAPGGHACSCSSCGPSDGTMFREDTTVYVADGSVYDMIQGAGAPGASLKFDYVGGVRPGDTPTDAPVCP